MASVVNVNISGTDELSATLTRSEQAVQRFGQTVSTQSGSFQRYEQGAVKARAALGPLQSGISELTGAMRQQSPAAAAAVSAVDNLSVSMIAAASSAGTWAGAIRVMMGLLNPWTIAIVAAGAALAYFSAQSAAAKKAQDEQFTTLQKTVDQFNALNRATELAGARTDRERLELGILQERRKILLEVADAGQRELLLSAQADKAAALRMEFNRKASEEQKKAFDQTRQGLIDQADALNEQSIRLDLGAEAADKFKIQNLLASEAVKKLGAEGVALVREIEWLMAGVRRASEEQKKLKEYIDDTNKSLAAEEQLAKDTAEAWGFYAKSIEDATKKQLDMIETERELGELSAERLRILGEDQQSEVMRLQTRIDYLQKIKALETDPNKLRLLDAQIANAQTSLQQIGTISIDIAGHVTRTIDDIFTALIQGTLKATDIGKAALATLGRVANDIFSQIIKMVVGGGGFSFGGGAAAAGTGGGGGGGVIGALGSIAQIGGGGFGGISGLIKSGIGVVGNLFGSATSGLFGFGSAAAGVSGPVLANSGFFSTLTGAIAAGVVDAISTVSTTAATAISSTLTAISSSISWIPFIGWAVAAITAIYRIVANQQERPSARIGAEFSGVMFDEATQQFSPGTIGVTIGRKVGIQNQQATAIANSVEVILNELVTNWTDILNLFPDKVQKEIIPALEVTNATLNQTFAKLKFSPGGSRSVQQELEALRGLSGQQSFLNAFLPAISTGIDTALQQAGIDVSDKFAGRFDKIWNQEGMDKVISDLKTLVSLTSGLATIAGSSFEGKGLGQFLTKQDIGVLSSQFGQLVSITDPQAFGKALEEVQANIKPITDALSQSLQQAAELFGRSIMAALEAVSESDAQAAFFNSLNQGIKEAVFGGITASLISTAEFSNLLAPLQLAIREAVQSSLTSGVFDQAAFQGSVLPAIEAILGRAETLRPLIAELQKFGQSINQRLGFGAAEAVTEPITTELTESAMLFGNSLITAMEAATQSEAMTNFTAAFNTGIKDAIFSGIIESFLATGFVDQILAPIRAAIALAVTESQTTGTFIMPNVQQLVQGASAAANTWQPLIAFLQEFAFGIRETLGLLPPAEVAPVAPGPTNVVINLNGVGTVDQGSIPELARRINFMLAPQLSPPA